MKKTVKLLLTLVVFSVTLLVGVRGLAADAPKVWPTAPLSPSTEFNFLGLHLSGTAISQSKSVQPSLTTKYTPEPNQSDPWKGGTFNVNWSDQVDIADGIGNYASAPLYGFSFVAHVNLSPNVTADDVLNSIDYQTAYLKIANTDFQLTSDNFEKIGDHTLRLTLRPWNAKNLLGGIWNLIVSGGLKKSLPVNFNVNVDVAKMTEMGATDDTSPNKMLTKGKFPPAQDKKFTMSVDFYGADQIHEGAVGILGQAPSGRVYAKLDSQGNIIPSNRVSASVDTWNSYLSPVDNKNEFNTNKDDSEVVSGSNLNLPGSFGARTLTPKLSEGDFADLDQADSHRFDRVVNYYTKENETAGANVSHTPNKTSGLNTPTAITYSGNDAQGTPLSPVALTVNDAHENNGEMTIDNLKNNVDDHGIFSGTAIQAGQPYPVEASWTAPYLKTGQIHYRLIDATNNKPIAGYEDKVFADVKNTSDNTATHSASMMLPPLPKGQYFFDFKLVDDYDPDASLWNWQIPEKMPYTPMITVTDVPKISGTNTLTDLDTKKSGDQLTAYAGNKMQETVNYTVDDMSNGKLSNQKILVGIPNHTTYVKDSLTFEVNGKKVDVTPTTDGSTMTILVNEELKAGAKLTVNYQYTVDQVQKVDIQTLHPQFAANVTVDSGNGQSQMTLAPVILNNFTFHVPGEEFKFSKVPANFTFGKNITKPYIPVELPMQSSDFSFDVVNTRVGTNSDHWQITAALSKEFQTTDGSVLLGAKLFFNQAGKKVEIGKDSASPIYTYDGQQKGEIPVTFSDQDKLSLQVPPDPNIQTDTPYTGEINWQLTNGPGE
ncbi:hypothetical protein [Enterococcus sp. CSURQ0835]|uniref:hypothetical protein n=1 Tax=Enterococcus sp. CSURQ0835 TaxID=2681394 RepID=UPI0013580DD4|nr:hypothetical protein [Enterococcus sp. CSURQ0835]